MNGRVWLCPDKPLFTTQAVGEIWAEAAGCQPLTHKPLLVVDKILWDTLEKFLSGSTEISKLIHLYDQNHRLLEQQRTSILSHVSALKILEVKLS